KLAADRATTVPARTPPQTPSNSRTGPRHELAVDLHFLDVAVNRTEIQPAEPVPFHSLPGQSGDVILLEFRVAHDVENGVQRTILARRDEQGVHVTRLLEGTGRVDHVRIE